jgi:hypothetical protein
VKLLVLWQKLMLNRGCALTEHPGEAVIILFEILIFKSK